MGFGWTGIVAALPTRLDVALITELETLSGRYLDLGFGLYIMPRYEKNIHHCGILCSEFPVYFSHPGEVSSDC